MTSEQPRLLLVTTVAITLRAFFLPLVMRLRAQGWRVDGFAAGIESMPECRAAFDRVVNAAWTRSPRDVGAMRRASRQLRELVRANGYELVHFHTPIAGAVGRHAIRHESATVLYTAHGFHFHPHGGRSSNAVYRAVERMASRWTDYLVVINEVDELAANGGGFAKRCTVVRLPGVGIDLDWYAPGPEVLQQARSTRASLRLGDDASLISMIAELNPGKRHLDALHALAATQRSDIHLAFAGEGPQKEQILAFARDHGLAAQVHFLGYVRDIRPLLCASQASLLPSEREGLPRGVMESLAMGTPVIGTDIRGIQDLLRDGAGLLVPLGDVDALAAALTRVVDDASLRQELSRRGAERIREFSLEVVLQATQGLYERAQRRRK